ncbi:MAG: DUF1320 domain-containing protein [Parvibaculum sp.]|uniref:gp436 family protein n=1 Tax=Parvibaculum sp. TaxID=2024848 RepID=UPI002727512B|nr:DUF1320 domain-containing protein [Parvibaculum sp.]MDO8838019.1 DUF1320 domain-containing protein [Parvibaculum sp.]
MSYVTLEKLISKFGARELVLLTDRAVPASGEIDEAIVAEAIAATDAEINAYLTRRYSLPLSPVPLLIENLAAPMARYHLHVEHAPAQVEKQYEAALRTLRDIASGKASLGDDDAAADLPSPSQGPRVQAGDPVFTTETLKGF